MFLSYSTFDVLDIWNFSNLAVLREDRVWEIDWRKLVIGDPEEKTWKIFNRNELTVEHTVHRERRKRRNCQC